MWVYKNKCLHSGIITHVKFLKLMYLATVVKIFKKVWMRNRIVLFVSYWIMLLSTSYRLPIHTHNLIIMPLEPSLPFNSEGNLHLWKRVTCFDMFPSRVTVSPTHLHHICNLGTSAEMPSLRSSLLEALVGRATWVIFMGSVVTVVFNGVKWTWKHVTRIVKRRVAINLHIECTGTWQT